MLTVATSRLLRQAGLAWAPRPGDRFVVADREMDEVVFVISDMVIEAVSVDYGHGPAGELLRFNGTTEWALDQLPVEQALWLPRESQLREALGDLFLSLARIGGDWVVTTVEGRQFAASDAEEAYAAAVLAALPAASP